MMLKDSKIDRRRFLGCSAKGLGSLCALSALTGCAGDKGQTHLQASGKSSVAGNAGMPTRVLGKTGLRVSVLSFGGGSQFLANEDGVWEPQLEKAVEAGINLFDTSSGYKWKASLTSEERFGKMLAPYRKKLILSTKSDTRDVETAKRDFERSLKRLRTDYVDILMIHSIEADEDIAALEKGVYKLAVQLKEQGAARFIGFSSMNSAAKSKAMIDALDLDVCLLAMNPTRYGDFTEVALPAAREKNLGVLAMKVMRNIVGEGKASPQELLQYALDQPSVASAVVGHVGLKTLDDNVRLMREIEVGKERLRENAQLETRLAGCGNARHLCWARPGYKDDGSLQC